MQALSVIGATTIHPGIAPKSVKTGGTSKEDPNAGNGKDASPIQKQKPITTADKAGAAILTILGVSIIVGGSIWIIM